jgi:hypothetical protein
MIPAKTIEELISKHSALEKIYLLETLTKSCLQKNQKSTPMLMKL